MKKIICILFALLLCLALIPAVATAADADDGWIEEQLREMEASYNPDIMVMSFVVGSIPWTTSERQYFTASGLPPTISEDQWLQDCAALPSRGYGYTVDNTGVKYTKFPQYDNEGYHFVNVTVNDVEVVRIGILVPDDDPDGDPVYYYMTQKHVASDETSDGNGSHTGSISALLLPDDAIFLVNYAVNEYEYSYEVWLNDQDVTNDYVDPSAEDPVTWLQTIFAGQNPSSTTNGAISFTATIPYGYSAQVLRYQYDDTAEAWENTPVDLTGPNATNLVNEGYPLGTEPVYEVYNDPEDNNAKKIRLKLNDNGEMVSPTTKRMSGVFYDEAIKQNRKIVVTLTPDKDKPVFDASLWLATPNASGRATTATNNPTTHEPNLWGAFAGNVDTEDDWNWNSGKTNAFSEKPGSLKGEAESLYKTHWFQVGDTWSLVWAFQTNKDDSYVMNSLELNGVHINIPFKSMYEGAYGEIPTGNTEEDCTTTTILPDGARVELTYHRVFTYQGTQRVYVLRITGARTSITVSGGNFMQYKNGAPEYVSTVLTGVTGGDGTDSFGYYSNFNTWETQKKVVIQVQDQKDNSPEPKKRGTTNFAGDPDLYSANFRFQLQTGYEDPVYLWEDRMSGQALEGSAIKNAHGVIPWKNVQSNLDSSGKLLPNAIYGPVPDDEGNEWYYIRISEQNKPGGDHKMCVMNLTSTAMWYMVRYMVGTQDDPITNAPSQADDNVQGMPRFDTDDSNWDDDLIPKDENGNPIPGSGGLEGQHLERYDDNNGNFYSRQTISTIPVSDAIPTTRDESKFFQYWVLVDKDEKIITGANKQPIIIHPNETMDLASLAKYAVALSSDIGDTDNNYYVLRLKGVWSDLPTDFKFYIRMVWTDENGKSHIMDLVQNVTTSSTDPNLTEDGCLIVTVNTVTDTFQDWFKAHPFYSYAPRNFISTKDRAEDRFTDQNGQIWEIYPSDFTSGSAEQGLKNKDAYYRVEVGTDNIVRYIVQREGTIVLYLNEVNGSLPVTKTVIGSDPGADEFTYTVTVHLLPSDIARASLAQGDPNYLTPESLKNMLPSGSYFGFPPSADMNDLSAFTGTDVNLHFKRNATGTDMTAWHSTATFTLKGGEATVLGVPQGSYTIEETAGEDYTVTVETDGRVTNDKTVTDKKVEAGKTATAVKYVNEVKPIAEKDTPRVSTKITGNPPFELTGTFGYTLTLVSGDSSQVEYQREGTTFSTSSLEEEGVTGSPFGDITFNHTGTYQFLVSETLLETNAEDNTIAPVSSTRALTFRVENIDGALKVTRITVDGTVYEGTEGDYALANAVVPFVHTYTPLLPDAVRVIPTVYKKLNGRNLLTASFDFVMTYLDAEYTATNDAAGNGQPGAVTFPAIDFTEPGTYTVTISEKIPPDMGAADHIIYDEDEIIITYDVEEVDGELKVTESYADGKDSFENQAYVDVSFTLRKNYNLSLRPGGRWNGDTFTVNATLISAPEGSGARVDGTEIALNQTADIVLTETDKADGKRLDIRFTNEGTYVFEVREENGYLPGVSYDGSIYYVTVMVTAEGKSLAASTSVTKNGKAHTEDAISFNNQYDPLHVDVTVNAVKILQDADGNRLSLTPGRFRFELAPVGQTPGSILTAKNDASGNFSFTLQNLSVNTYVYTLREIDDGENGVTYDTHTYTVTITVGMEQEDSAVTYTIEFADGDEPVAVPTFTNTVRSFGQLVVNNTVTGTGADPDREFTYTFTFEGTGNALRYELRSSPTAYSLPESAVMPLFVPEGVAAVTGTIRSGGSLQLRDGQSVVIYGLPTGASYTVTESDYDRYAVSHDGTDGDTASGVIGNGHTVVNYLNTLNLTEPDVTITKAQSVNGVASGPSATVKAGDTVTYTITVKNVGELPAQAVTVTDAVPAGLTVTGIDNGGQNSSGTITWTIDTLNAEESRELSFTVTVPTVVADQSWTNTATVVWDGEATGNTSDPVSLHTAAVGDWMLSKTVLAASGDPIDADRAFSFTVKLADDSGPRAGSFRYEGGVIQDSGAAAPAGGTLVFNDSGEATVTLKHGQTITVRDMPAGLSYTVTEATAASYTPTIANGAGRIEANSVTEVSVTNTYNLTPAAAAIPEITKALIGRNLADGEFSFMISCEPTDGVTLPEPAVNGADGRVPFGQIIFTRPGTYLVTVREVIPADAVNNTLNGVTYDAHALQLTYEVADSGLGGLTVTGPTVSSPGGTYDTVFINTVDDTRPSSGQLIVSKQVTGNDGETERDFRFEAEIGGQTYAFTLKSGEQWTSGALDAGTPYAVREIDANVDGYLTIVPDNAVGTIPVGSAVTVAFVNTRTAATGSLSIRKQVTGKAGDTQAAFSFMVMLSDTHISGSYGDLTFSGGVATFTLRHGESKTATGLPAGIRYSVQEQAANQDGYATAATGETGVITADTVMTAIFVNAKDEADVPQTGDNSHPERWLALALAALVCMVFNFPIRRRKTGGRS